MHVSKLQHEHSAITYTETELGTLVRDAFHPVFRDRLAMYLINGK